MLFDLEQDPDENNNLIGSSAHAPVVSALMASIMSVVDVPKVAQEVAEYNKQIFAWWMDSTPNWKSIISKQIAATRAWDYNTTASFEAVARWMSQPAEVVACRGTLVSRQ